MSENTPDPWAEVTDSVTKGGRSDSADAHEHTRSTPTTASSDGAGAGQGTADEGAADQGTTDQGAAGGTATGTTATGRTAEGGDRSTPATEQYTDARQVLDAVAQGRLAPEEASRLLDGLRRSEEDAGTTARSGERAVTAEPTPASIDRVRVRAVGRRVRLIGEPFVSTVAVDGPHVVRQDGNTLVVASEGEFGASLDGFTLTPPRSFRDVQQKFMELGRELAIRVNPDLIVEAEITAGSLNAERLPRLENVRATAGSVRVRDIEGPLELLVQAGSAQVEGRLHKGHSRFRTESGSLQVRLLKDSSVRIRQDAQLGRVVWDSEDTEEYVVGDGSAQLDLEVVMAQANVKEAK